MCSDIPKVKAYLGYLEMSKSTGAKELGLEFVTEVRPDRCVPPPLVYWSGEREGVHIEDGYAKISIRIVFCNQVDED
jgi:hypothetical protein